MYLYLVRYLFLCIFLLEVCLLIFFSYINFYFYIPKMKDLYKILDVKPIRPIEWSYDSRILKDVCHTIRTLVPFTPEEKYLVFKRKIISILPRNQKVYQKKINKSIEEERWLIRDKKEKIFGPFTKSEMRDKITNNELNDLYIKRDFDKDFIEYETISREVPNFLDSDKLNDFFNLNSLSLEVEGISLSDTDKKNRHDELQPFVTNKFKVEERSGFYKCTEFLRYKKVNMNIDVIVKKLYGKSREASVNLIGFMTNLSLSDSERLVDLIIEESKNSVIVDKEGFMKVHKKYTKK
jgi:hypothetical protein